MITHKKEAFDPEIQLKLKKWLTSPEAHRIAEVVAGKAKEHLAAASESAMKATPDNQYHTASDADIRAARRYQTCLDVLAEITNQKEPYCRVKLS